MDWHSAVIYGGGAAMVIYVLNTLRQVLEVLKCINANLAVLTDRLAPPPSGI